MPEQTAVVQAHLGIERQDPFVGRDHERVDLHEGRIRFAKEPIDGVHDVAGLFRRPPSQTGTEGQTSGLERHQSSALLIGSRRISSGVVAATSSMSIPPAELSIMTGRASARSISNPK